MTTFHAPAASLGDLAAETVAALLAAASDITLILDREGVIRDLAASSEALAEAGCAAWIGQPWVDTVTPECRQNVQMLLGEASAPAPAPRWRELNQVLPCGRERPVQFSALARPDSSGTTIAIGRDLAATASMQQQLVEAQPAVEREYRKFHFAEPRTGTQACRSHELPHSAGQLAELVGRVPLKKIVGDTTDLIEQMCIEAALELTGDNRSSAAELLGLSRQSLYMKMRRAGRTGPVSSIPAITAH